MENLSNKYNQLVLGEENLVIDIKQGISQNVAERSHNITSIQNNFKA